MKVIYIIAIYYKMQQLQMIIVTLEEDKESAVQENENHDVEENRQEAVEVVPEPVHAELVPQGEVAGN